MLYLVKCSLCGKILCQVCHGITLYRHAGSIPWASGCGSGIHTDGVVHKIGRETGILVLAVIEIPCQLVDDCADHLKVSQLFCTYVGEEKTPTCESMRKK